MVMAVAAGHVRVPVREAHPRMLRARVRERDRLPPCIVVTIFAAGTELAVVGILVAIGARAEPEVGVLRRVEVALRALHRLVRAVERETREVVIEVLKTKVRPGDFVVAPGA